MDSGAFDDLTDIFESIIDWPKRLAHEEPFYQRLFERAGVKSVVDVACGTGHHASMFHSWGLQVEGADLSPRMIERARANFGEPAGLRWVVRGYDQPIDGQFDAAVCVGNSLALAGDKSIVEKAVARMCAGVRKGGLVIVHVLNVWSLPDGPIVWQKRVRSALPGGEAFVIKGVHRASGSGFVDLLVNPLQDASAMRATCVPFLGLEASDLERTMKASGAARVNVVGGYRDQPFDREKSTDLIVVAEKSAGV